MHITASNPLVINLCGNTGISMRSSQAELELLDILCGSLKFFLVLVFQ